MTSSDPLAAFDDDVVAAVAAETGTDVTRLRDALRRHQEHARSLPGVDDLVYEWRRFLPYEPLVRREERAYVLALERSVWAEFGEQLSFDELTLEAVMAVHDRQARLAVDDSAAGGPEDDPETVFETGAALVLTR